MPGLRRCLVLAGAALLGSASAFTTTRLPLLSNLGQRGPRNNISPRSKDTASSAVAIGSDSLTETRDVVRPAVPLAAMGAPLSHPDGEVMDYGPGCDEHECQLSYEETTTGELLLKAGAEAAAATLESLDSFNPVQINEKTGVVSLDGQKLLNLCVLLASGLWIAHSVITVDHAIWRGWTWQEIAMRLPYDNWGGYVGALDEHPIFTKTAINVFIYLVGDWLAQVEFGRKDMLDFDLGRTLRNGLIGAIFGPLVHYYYQWSDVVLPMSVATNRPLKILMDQSIYFVSKCSAYMFLVGLLRGDSLPEVKDQWQSRIGTVVVTGWKFWPLVHIFTYSVIPAEHRVLWVNSVDLIWSSILSGLASNTKPEEEDGKGAASS